MKVLSCCDRIAERPPADRPALQIHHRVHGFGCEREVGDLRPGRGKRRRVRLDEAHGDRHSRHRHHRDHHRARHPERVLRNRNRQLAPHLPHGVLAANPQPPQVHSESVLVPVGAIAAQQDVALEELLERLRDPRLVQPEAVPSSLVLALEVVEARVRPFLRQAFGQQRQHQLLVALEPVPEELHLGQRVVDDPVHHLGDPLARRVSRADLVQVVHQALADRLRVEGLPGRQAVDRVHDLVCVLHAAFHRLADQTDRVLALEEADHPEVGLWQELLPVLATAMVEMLRAGEDEIDPLVLHQVGEDQEGFPGQQALVDLVLEQLVFVEQQDQPLLRPGPHHLLHELPKRGVVVRVRGELGKRDPGSIRAERGPDLLRDARQEIDLVAHGHGLHVDEHRDEIRPQALVHDLEENRGLAAAALAAEDQQQPAVRGIGGVLEAPADQVELGLAAEEHRPVSNRVPYDVGIGADRREAGIRGAVVHGKAAPGGCSDGAMPRAAALGAVGSLLVISKETPLLDTVSRGREPRVAGAHRGRITERARSAPAATRRSCR